MKSEWTKVCSALLLASSVTATQAQSFLQDFDASNDLANNFNTYFNATPPLGSPYSQVGSGGVGGSGAVSVALGGAAVTADATLIYNNLSFDFSTPGATLNIASMLNVSTQTAGGNRLLQLGFVNESTNGMNGNAGIAFTSLRLSSAGTSGNIYTPQFQTKTAAGATVSTTLTPNVTLTPGEWYELSGTFLNLGGGNIQASGFLQDFGTDGQTAGSVVFNFPTTTLNSTDIASDSSVWGALRGFNADGLNEVDNFRAGVVVVPEPSATALIFVGLGGFYLVPLLRQRQNIIRKK
jgi:hypothetical protein